MSRHETHTMVLNLAEFLANAVRQDDEVFALRARVAQLETVNAALLSQARAHAMEARTQRSTVNECLQAVSGATGEKADWNGAQPVREALADRVALAAEVKRLREALRQWEWRDESYDQGETQITHCPACGALSRDGHMADCWMKAALTQSPGGDHEPA